MSAQATLRLSGDDLPPGVEITVDPFLNILSHAITPTDMWALASRIRQHLSDPKIAGIVVTHGTVVMEESAFLCDLLLTPGKPVLFTGAMLPALSNGEDGQRNLRDALMVAMSADAADLGVLVCMDGEVHLARHVRKMHSSALNAFQSPGFGPIGVVDGKFILNAKPARCGLHFDPPALELNVDLLSVASGMDDRFVRCSMQRGARGLVVEGFPGRGAVTPAIAAALPDAIAQGIAVILATRSPSASVAPSSGGLAGSATLSRRGVIMGGRLSGPKLRLLLMVSLGTTADLARIAEIVARF